METVKEYKSIFKDKPTLEEMSIDKARQEIFVLYNSNKNKFDTLTDLVDFISHKLGVSKNIVLQVLETV